MSYKFGVPGIPQGGGKPRSTIKKSFFLAAFPGWVWRSMSFKKHAMPSAEQKQAST